MTKPTEPVSPLDSTTKCIGRVGLELRQQQMTTGAAAERVLMVYFVGQAVFKLLLAKGQEGALPPYAAKLDDKCRVVYKKDDVVVCSRDIVWMVVGLVLLARHDPESTAVADFIPTPLRLKFVAACDAVQQAAGGDEQKAWMVTKEIIRQGALHKDYLLSSGQEAMSPPASADKAAKMRHIITQLRNAQGMRTRSMSGATGQAQGSGMQQEEWDIEGMTQRLRLEQRQLEPVTEHQAAAVPAAEAAAVAAAEAAAVPAAEAAAVPAAEAAAMPAAEEAGSPATPPQQQHPKDEYYESDEFLAELYADVECSPERVVLGAMLGLPEEQQVLDDAAGAADTFDLVALVDDLLRRDQEYAAWEKDLQAQCATPPKESKYDSRQLDFSSPLQAAEQEEMERRAQAAQREAIEQLPHDLQLDWAAQD